MQPREAMSVREHLPAGSRYQLLNRIAIGGTATVYMGRLLSSVGFSRLVAIKRAHPHLVADPEARRALVEEARLASRIHHANVVAVYDIEEMDDEVLLVMDYVEGATLAELLAAGADGKHLPPSVAVKIALDTCAGLQAVHDLADDDGRPLGLVHRDVSPQNVLVGVDGTARIGDLGLAKLARRSQPTSGVLRGKVSYVAPECVRGQPCTPRGDLFALGVVIWEALSNQRLFRGANDAETLNRVLQMPAPLLSEVAPWLGPTFDGMLAKLLHKDPEERYGSAAEVADAIELSVRSQPWIPRAAEVATHVRRVLSLPVEDSAKARTAGRRDATDFTHTVSMPPGSIARRDLVGDDLESMDRAEPSLEPHASMVSDAAPPDAESARRPIQALDAEIALPRASKSRRGVAVAAVAFSVLLGSGWLLSRGSEPEPMQTLKSGFDSGALSMVTVATTGDDTAAATEPPPTPSPTEDDFVTLPTDPSAAPEGRAARAATLPALPRTSSIANGAAASGPRKPRRAAPNPY